MGPDACDQDDRRPARQVKSCRRRVGGRGVAEKVHDNAARARVLIHEKAERFPELQNVPSRVFEQNFRRLRLLFKPEDLRF